MKFFKETTDWGSKNIPNHTYLLTTDKSKMIAYIRANDEVAFTFKNPIRIDTRKRTFKEVKNTFGYTMPSEGKQYKVTGSKGDEYTVTDSHGKWTCSCSGFSFRGKCKHIDGVAK